MTQERKILRPTLMSALMLLRSRGGIIRKTEESGKSIIIHMTEPVTDTDGNGRRKIPEVRKVIWNTQTHELKHESEIKASAITEPDIPDIQPIPDHVHAPGGFIRRPDETDIRDRYVYLAFCRSNGGNPDVAYIGETKQPYIRFRDHVNEYRKSRKAMYGRSRKRLKGMGHILDCAERKHNGYDNEIMVCILLKMNTDETRIKMAEKVFQSKIGNSGMNPLRIERWGNYRDSMIPDQDIIDLVDREYGRWPHQKISDRSMSLDDFLENCGRNGCIEQAAIQNIMIMES